MTKACACETALQGSENLPGSPGREEGGKGLWRGFVLPQRGLCLSRGSHCEAARCLDCLADFLYSVVLVPVPEAVPGAGLEHEIIRVWGQSLQDVQKPFDSA